MTLRGGYGAGGIVSVGVSLVQLVLSALDTGLGLSNSLVMSVSVILGRLHSTLRGRHRLVLRRHGVAIMLSRRLSSLGTSLSAVNGAGLSIDVLMSRLSSILGLASCISSRLDLVLGLGQSVLSGTQLSLGAGNGALGGAERCLSLLQSLLQINEVVIGLSSRSHGVIVGGVQIVNNTLLSTDLPVDFIQLGLHFGLGINLSIGRGVELRWICDVWVVISCAILLVLWCYIRNDSPMLLGNTLINSGISSSNPEVADPLVSRFLAKDISMSFRAEQTRSMTKVTFLFTVSFGIIKDH